jgi:hypothetical protein
VAGGDVDDERVRRAADLHSAGAFDGGRGVDLAAEALEKDLPDEGFDFFSVEGSGCGGDHGEESFRQIPPLLCRFEQKLSTAIIKCAKMEEAGIQ